MGEEISITPNICGRGNYSQFQRFVGISIYPTFFHNANFIFINLYIFKVMEKRFDTA